MKRTKPLTMAEAKTRAGALCSKCEQCTSDLLKKFSTWGLTQSHAHQLIEELERLNWVNDFRYARAFAHDKLMFSGWGKAKITAYLYARRLPREAIEEAFDEISAEDYTEIAERVMKAKIKALRVSPDDYETRVKLMRFGMGRGFEASLVATVIDGIRRCQKEGDEEE